MSDWNFLNRHRVRPDQDRTFGSAIADGFNGAFCLVLNGLRVKCIVSDGMDWQHVSVSIEGSELPPSWSIMTKVKDLFWEPEDWVVQFHPAHSEYVNNHPGVLHLCRPTKENLPTPDRIMVGCKTDADIERINAHPESPVKILKL